MYKKLLDLGYFFEDLLRILDVGIFKALGQIIDRLIVHAPDRVHEGRPQVLIVFLQTRLVVVKHQAGQAVVDAVGLGKPITTFRLKNDEK